MWPNTTKRIVQEVDPKIQEYKWLIPVNKAFEYEFLDEEGWVSLRNSAKKRGCEDIIVAYTNQYEDTVERIRKNVYETLEKLYIYPYPIQGDERSG